MKNIYLTVGACVFLSFIGLEFSQAQSSGPQFPDCNSSVVSLCVSDEGVRLPPNNKIYLGEENPEATSCSVHVKQKTRVRSTCGRTLQYEVQLFLEGDTSNAIILQPFTTIVTDSAFEAELSFDSEFSPDSILRKNGIPYSSGCNIFHLIKWIVTDSCGLVNECEMKIHLYDCSKPSINPSPLYMVRSNVVGLIFLRLDSLLKDPVDDCTTKNNISYSLYPDHFGPDSSFHICDVPAIGVELPFNVWIADEGSDINCDGRIDWSERNIENQEVLFVFVGNGYIDCNQGDPYLSGDIETEDRQAVEKVELTLTSPGHSYPGYITGSDGKFFFGIPVAVDYSLHADRNDFHRNGVSTLDLVRIKKHLLGIEDLSSPYDIIAADANNNQNINVLDLLELRKLILGIYTELPNNRSWRFVPKNYIFSDTLHPWPFPESITFNGSNSGNLDFIAVKIGDVNNTVQANAQMIESRTLPQKINWFVNQENYSSGDIINIDFSIDDRFVLQGFQFTVSNPDLEFIDVSAGKTGITDDNYASFKDKMTLSWFDEDGFNTNKGDVLFTIKARANRNGNLQKSLSINSDITEAEMYGINDEIFKPVLSVSESETENNFILFAPEPNPWHDRTTIPFYSAHSGKVIVEIFDLNGKLIFQKETICEPGNNEIKLSSSDFSARGMMFYIVKTATSSLTQKMIVLD